MLTLDVYRFDGTPINRDIPNTVLFYDEKIRVKVAAPRACELHLNATIAGHLPDRGREHSIVIYDGSLPHGQNWDEDVLIRHPRCPFQDPRLEIAVTAKYIAGDPLATASAPQLPASELVLTPFEPVLPTKSGFLVPFTHNLENSCVATGESSSPSLSHSKSLSMISNSFDNAEAYATSNYNAGDAGQNSHREFVATNRSITPESAKDAETKGGIEIVHWHAPLMPALELEITSQRPALERDRVISEIAIVSGVYAAQINRCHVTLDGGLAKQMGRMPVPFELKPYEKLAVGYNLELRTSSAPTSFAAARRPLTITLEYEMRLPASELTAACLPKIKTEWTPVVDFEATQGPLPKTPALHMNISSPMPGFGGGSTNAGGGGASGGAGIGTNSANSSHENGLSTLDLISSGRAPTTTSNLTLMGGITIMITGPQFVRVGDQFEWEIKVMNRSQRHRIFTMTFGAISKDVFRPEPQLVTDRLAFLSNYNPDQLRRRSAQHRRGTASGRGIIPLCQELKVGNLAPHVCFETKISLLALAPGTHTVEDARIEDSASRDTYDVGGLLEVIVESR